LWIVLAVRKVKDHLLACIIASLSNTTSQIVLLEQFQIDPAF